MSNPVCDAGTLAGVAQSVVNDLARGWCWGSASSPVPSMDKRTGPEGDDNSRRLLALCAGQERRGRLKGGKRRSDRRRPAERRAGRPGKGS